ncbi:MAG: hypothetical protein AAF495_17525 [Pseudomonadota bacterium]
MTDGRPTFEELNAYVDKELPPERAAQVARAIAGDPRLAQQVAALSQLRAAVAESVEIPEIALPAPAPRPARWLIAACVATLLLAASALFVHLMDRPQTGDWLAAAWQLHDGWSLPKDDPSGTAQVHAAAFAATYVPDLSASKLSLVYATRAPYLGDDPALVVGYRGTRGCKVTLVIAAAQSGSEHAPRLIEEPARRAYAWRAGAFDYLLLAEAMDPKRFLLIAKSVERASIERLPFDEETRSALLENRRASKPCLA